VLDVISRRTSERLSEGSLSTDWMLTFDGNPGARVMVCEPKNLVQCLSRSSRRHFRVWNPE